MESIVSSLITGILALAGTVLTCSLASKKTDQNIRVNQAVTDTKIDELTREVREHNGFAHEIPVLKMEIDNLKKEVHTLRKFHTNP